MKHFYSSIFVTEKYLTAENTGRTRPPKAKRCDAFENQESFMRKANK